MFHFAKWLEAVEFDQEYIVKVTPSVDMVVLEIDGWGYLRLRYSYSGWEETKQYHWTIYMISGDRPGAGTVLYFAALLWAYSKGDSYLKKLRLDPAGGLLACDSTLSPDAIRARARMQRDYGEYIEVMPHPDAGDIKVHRDDGTDWRRKATAEEATIWKLKEIPPWIFRFR